MDQPTRSLAGKIKHEWAIASAIIFLGLIMRLYQINQPLIESHQVRQAQTAMIARNLHQDSMNIFRTRLDIFGNIPGYVIQEFPLMHWISALFYYLFGVHEAIGRLVSVAFSVGAMFLIYGLARQFLSGAGAFAALILYSFSPMNIFFSRAFMPESSMMFFMIGAIYFFTQWLNKQTLALYLTAAIFAAMACLIKPTAGIIFAPILTAWFLKNRWGLFRRLDFWLYLLLTMFPFFLWAAYARYFNSLNPLPFGGYGESWLEIMKTRGITSHWFDLKFYKFVGGSIIFLLLTPLGFMGTVSSIFCAPKKGQSKILYSWLAAIIIYFYLLAGPNSGHVYYHLLLLPLAAIFFGFAIEWLLNKYKSRNKMVIRQKAAIWSDGILIFILLVGYILGYIKYFKYMYSNRMPYVLEISKIIRENTPENRFILDNESGLLTSVIAYYAHSKAQPFSVTGSAIAELERLRTLGATTFVAMETAYGSCVQSTKEKKEFWDYLNKNYKALAINDHYVIFDLRSNPGEV